MLPKTNWCATDLTKFLITGNPVIAFKIIIPQNCKANVTNTSLS